MTHTALSLLLAAMASGAASQPQIAQVERFLLAPGSSVGPNTKVVPTNCYRDRSGQITCDTKLVNPPGSLEAKPLYSPFSN
ncbi:MAG: hypothetical protein VKK62_00830 [Synechococcaceae cyanobacterium]|nr:hypothetical protein [Synechococcaceae cyanobacterium]